MKKGTLVLSLIIASAGLTTLSFVEAENNSGCKVLAQETEEKQSFSSHQDTLSKQKEVVFDIHKTENMTVTKEKLMNAKHLGDFVKGYPTNWIKQYESVEIKATNNGEELSVKGINGILNKRQRIMLQQVDWATSVSVIVNYTRENVITKEKKSREMKVSMSLVPAEVASFEGGKDELLSYFEDNSKGRIDVTKIDSIKIQQQSLVTIPGFISVLFNINELGKAENIILQVSSNVPETDELILDLIKNMPVWKPAKDAEGNKVKQAFELTVGGPFVGC